MNSSHDCTQCRNLKLGVCRVFDTRPPALEQLNECKRDSHYLPYLYCHTCGTCIDTNDTWIILRGRVYCQSCNNIEGRTIAQLQRRIHELITKCRELKGMAR